MTTDLAPRDNVVELARPVGGGLALSFQEMVQRVALVDQFYREVMQEGTDYGKVGGTDKPCLFQPGAQMLDQIFGYAPAFEVMDSSVIDWARAIPFFHYVVRCRLISRKTGEVVAEGIGSCNSYEDKYRWRNAKRVCPDCGKDSIIKGKQEYGGGWLCFKKQGGCGAKFGDGSPEIEGQIVGKVENEDTASLENTISKMAQKRAHVAATLNATGASRIFTQDIEDLPQFQNALVIESQYRSASKSDGRRQRLLEQLRRGFVAVKALGADVDEDQDLDSMTDDEISDLVKALAGMVTSIKAELAKQEQKPTSTMDPEWAPEEDGAPF